MTAIGTVEFKVGHVPPDVAARQEALYADLLKPRGLATPAVRGELRRLLVDLERPAQLAEWSHSPRTAHHGAVRIQDKHGNEIPRAA